MRIVFSQQNQRFYVRFIREGEQYASVGSVRHDFDFLCASRTKTKGDASEGKIQGKKEKQRGEVMSDERCS